MTARDTPELSRIVPIDSIGSGDTEMRVRGEPAELAALSRRFGLIGIGRLEAVARLSRAGDEVRLSGLVEAELVQPCSISGEPVDTAINESVNLVFRPEPTTASKPEEEVELETRELDVIWHDGQSIDVGEAIAETVALAIDPYVRGPGAEGVIAASGIKSEEEAGPFGALADLKRRLQGE